VSYTYTTVKRANSQALEPTCACISTLFTVIFMFLPQIRDISRQTNLTQKTSPSSSNFLTAFIKHYTPTNAPIVYYILI